jgi:hypothetical protein
MNLKPETVKAAVLADRAIAWAQITSHMEVSRMNKHSLTYVDLHPEPVQQEDEPSDWLIWLGAAVVLVGACATVAILFTLGGGS